MRRYGVIYQKQKREAHDIFQPDGHSRDQKRWLQKASVHSKV